MGNKRICWVEKIDNAKDTVEKIALTKEAMDYYSRKMMEFLAEEGVAGPDRAFVSACAAKVSEYFYNKLDSNGKELCSLLVRMFGINAEETKENMTFNENEEEAPDEE